MVPPLTVVPMDSLFDGDAGRRGPHAWIAGNGLHSVGAV